VHEN
jgi:hypothetical protein